jgi:hypothetical protein
MMIINIYNYLYKFTAIMETLVVEETIYLTLHDITKMCNHLPKPIVAIILSHISTELIWLCRKDQEWHNFIWGKNGLSGIGVFLNTHNQDVVSYALATMSKMDICIPVVYVRLPQQRIVLLTKYLRAYIHMTQLQQPDKAERSVQTITNIIDMYVATRKDDDCQDEYQNEKCDVMFDTKQVNPICVVMYSLLNDNNMTLKQTFEVINRIVPILTRKYLFNINDTIRYIRERWGENNLIVQEMTTVLQK